MIYLDPFAENVFPRIFLGGESHSPSNTTGGDRKCKLFSRFSKPLICKAQFSVESRKTKANVITLANHNGIQLAS